MHKKQNISILSPLLYLISILIKPTSLILFPFYVFYFFKNINFNKKNLLKIVLSSFLCLLLIYFSFKPFLNTNNSFTTEIYKVVSMRITSSSKGLSRASNSAFNIYSLIFEIDNTYGGYRVLGLSLDSIGLLFYILINCISLFVLSKNNKNNNTIKLLFTIYFIGQSSFLFMTGMLERYFFPAFLASVLLMFLSSKQFSKYMIIQNLVWILNLIYSYFQRNIGWIKTLFENNSFFLIRIISLLSIINLILVYRRFMNYPKKYSATKNRY